MKIRKADGSVVEVEDDYTLQDGETEEEEAAAGGDEGGEDGKEADHIGQPQENLGHFIEINDMTEDFDYPHDYERWKKHYAKS